MIQLPKYTKNLFLLFLGLTTAPLAAKAGCVFSGEEKVELFLSPQTQSWGNFLGQQEIYPSFINKCNDDTGKFLMISLGVSQASQDASVKDTFIFETYKPSQCQLKNSASLTAIDPALQLDHFSQQFKILRSCFDIKVQDMGKIPLQYNAKQDFCQLIPTNDGGVILRGDMCFLKIGAKNQFAVTPVLKSECLNPDFLKAKGLEPQDLQANLNVLVAGDDSGLSEDLTHIGLRSLRLNITPHTGILPLTEDYGAESPRFITTYGADVDWGPVHIRPLAERTKIDLSLLASNVSSKSCRNGHCTRTSNYVVPAFGQVEIYEYNPGKRPLLKEEWWDGGFVAPNWQGFLTGIGYTSAEQIFEAGKKYRIQMTFQDPTDDFAIYLAGLSQILINLTNMSGGTVGVDILPGLSVIQELGVLPPTPGTGSLRRDNQPVNLSEISKGLSGVIANRIWPAYYDKICTENNNCQKLGKQKYYQRLIMEFVAGEVDSSSGELMLKNIQLQKQSTLFKSYPLNNREFPAIECGDNQ